VVAGGEADAADAADVGGADNSLAGASESGVPEVSGMESASDAVSAPGFTSSGDGGWVRSIGLAGNGGTVGKYSEPRCPQPASEPPSAQPARMAKPATIARPGAAARIRDTTRMTVPE